MKNKWPQIRLMLVILLAVIYLGSPGIQAAASQLPYDTYYRDGFGQLVKVQPAYVPAGIIGFDSPVSSEAERAAAKGDQKLQLNQPKDLFVDSKDHIYIADTGNHRIVHLDEHGRFVREITLKDRPLKKPGGLFVDATGHIYIADTGNNRIVHLDAQGNLLYEFGRPESTYFPDSLKYDPVNLIVDKRGFIYVTTLGAYQGLVQLDTEGEFVGFFGPNKVQFSLFDAFKRFVYTREMYQRELKKLPGAIANTTIDKEGFVYTVTKEMESNQVKKLNIAGLNQLEGKGDFANLQPVKTFGETLGYRRDDLPPQLNDITVDDAGNMTVIDGVTNNISQYDRSGNLLFFWGGDAVTATSKTGVVKAPAAIANNSKGELLILDSVNNIVQILRLSEFGELVHKANALTQEGRYEESEPLWSEVRRLNAQYTPALIGLAKAAYKKEDYKRAEKLFYQAGVIQGYSDSFWQNRLKWFQSNFALLMNIVLAAGVAYLVWGRISKEIKRQSRTLRFTFKSELLDRLKHVFYMMKHPVDGFYAIRYEGKAGLVSSAIIFILVLGAYGYMQAGTSFIFNPQVIIGIDLLPTIVQFVGIWIGWVIANYLVSSLLRGEGRFRDVLYSSAYILFPIILIGTPVTILSNALTLNELAIFNFLKLSIVIWTVLLAVWMVMGIHNYTFFEALFNILLTLLTLAMLVVLLFIFISLSIELINFVYSLYQEVIIR